MYIPARITNSNLKASLHDPNCREITLNPNADRIARLDRIIPIFPNLMKSVIGEI